MRKLLFYTLLLFCPSILSAQNFAWANKIGSTGSDVCRDIATDAAGNVYSTGTFTGSADFDPGAGTTTLTSAGGTDIFISKLDAAGALVWAVRIGNASSEEANGIALDAAGNIHITGSFYGTVDFDPGAGVVNSGNMTGADIYVLKLTNSAGFVWFRQFGGTNDNQVGNKIAVDAAGNVYSTGQSIGVIDFDPGAGVANLGVSFSGNTNFYVSKLDASGNYVWAKVMGNANSSAYGTDIVVSSTQEVYTCGYFIATSLDFDPGAGTVSLSTGSAYDGFVHKLTASGAYSFVRRIGGGNTPDACNAITMDAYGIYTTGYIYGTVDLDPGAGTANHTSVGLTDIYVQKMDWGGVYLWSKTMGGTGEDYGYGISVDVAGGVYTTGFFTGAVDFDPNAGTQTLTAVNQRDAFISKLNPSGLTNATYAWGFALGGTGIETGLGIDVNVQGDVYTGGYFGGVGDFDPTAGIFNMTPVGSNDVFIQKMTQCVVPAAPNNTNAPASPYICYNTSRTLTASGVGTLGWYTAATGGTYLGAGSSYNTGNLIANTTYYVQDSLCAASSTRRAITVVVTPLLTSSVSAQTNISCNGGTNGAATILPAGGSPTYTYAWAPSGGTAATASGLAAGAYTCTVTDALGCVAVQAVSISQPAPITASVTAQSNVACSGGTNGSATLAPIGGTGPYTYAWSSGGGTAATASGLAANTYTCTITDANTCTGTQSVTITQPTVITSSVSAQANVLCNGGTNGSATVLAAGGAGSFTYSWTPSGGNAATATGLQAATYTCNITDGNGCTRQQTVTITQPLAITSSVSAQTNISCNGGTNGAATVLPAGGTPGYTYLWSPSGGTAASVTGLPAASYSCAITDANGCTTNQSVTLTQPAALTAAVSSLASVLCHGGSDGSAVVTANGGTGPFTYLWAPSGGNAATASGLAAATYTCTVMDVNGCTNTQTALITEPTALTSAVSSQTDLTCNGGNNGAATILAGGGTTPYAYTWSPSGGTTATETGLTAGMHSCTITDANNCTLSQSVVLSEPTALVVGLSSTPVECNGGSSTITVSATGGTPTYSGTGSFTVTAGTYTYPVTDTNGCASTANITITEPSIITTNQTITVCAGESITVGANTYSATGTFSDLLTSSQGCDSTVNTNLTVAAQIDVTTTPSGNSISVNQNGASYQWVDCLNGNAPVPGAFNQTFTPAVSGDYAVIVTVGNCSDTSICTSVLTGIRSGENIAFKLYPNPTSGAITVELNAVSSDAQIEIFNATGQLMRVETPLTATVSLQLPEGNGIYLVRVSINGMSRTQKVIKE